MPSKADSSLRSFIPRPTLAGIEKKTRSPNKTQKVLHSRFGIGKENRLARKSINKSAGVVKRKRSNSQLKVRNDENIPPVALEGLKNGISEIQPAAKSYVQKQIDSAADIQFEPDSKSLMSILNNKGITNELGINGLFSNSNRPSLYRMSNRFSTKKSTLEEATKRLASVCDRIVNAPVDSTVAANVVRHTPVRLSLYGRCSSSVSKPFSINTPKSLFPGASCTTAKKAPNNVLHKKDDFCANSASSTVISSNASVPLSNNNIGTVDKFVESYVSVQKKLQPSNDVKRGQHQQTPSREKCVVTFTITAPPDDLERQIDAMSVDELRCELVCLEKRKSYIERRLKAKQVLAECQQHPNVASVNDSSIAMATAGVAKNNQQHFAQQQTTTSGLTPINESVETGDDVIVGSGDRSAACRTSWYSPKRDSSAFAVYDKTGCRQQQLSQQASSSSAHLVQTPKPKRRLNRDEDVSAPLNESLVLSPLCDADLVTVDPPIRTPLLLRSVAARAKYEMRCSTNGQHATTLNSSPIRQQRNRQSEDMSICSRSGDLTNYDVTFSVRHVSPIEKVGQRRRSSFWFSNLLSFDETLDRLCDEEVEAASNFFVKRPKMTSYRSDDDVVVYGFANSVEERRLLEPVALTLTVGDDTSFIPIVEE